MYFIFFKHLLVAQAAVSELRAFLAAFRVCSFDSNDSVMLFSENKYDDDDTSGSPSVYQPRHLQPSSQDPLFPAGLPSSNTLSVFPIIMRL